MRLPLRSFAVLGLAAGVATCVDVATGPKPASARRGRILIAPQFSASAARTASQLADFNIRYDSARVVIVRPVADTLIDTTLAFRPGQQDVTLDLTVPVHSDGEVFDAGMQFRDAARVLFQGNTKVASHASNESTPNSTTLQVDYVGPGSSVVRLQISPRNTSVPTNSTTTFTATGFDAAGTAVPVPVVWQVSDPSVAEVTASGQDALIRAVRGGTVNISARTPRDITDQVSLSVLSVPASIALISGGGQTSAVGAALPSPITVEVRSSSNVALPGVAVTFTPPAGGSATPTSATTDAAGRASTSVILGRVSGAQSITVTSGSASLSVPATALAAGPASLAIVSGDNQTDTVRKALRAPLVVKVLDQFTNPVAGATVSWSKSGGGALGAATSTTGADGQASVSYTLGAVVGDETIVASVTGVATSATFTVHAVRSLPASMNAIAGTSQSAAVNTNLPAELVVKVVDAGNFPVSGATVNWAATNGTVTPSSTSDADGLARATLKLGTAVGAASATASIGTVAVTFTATALPGPVSAVVFKRQPAGAVANLPIAPPVEVQLFDAFGNATTSTAAVTVALSGGAAEAALSGTATKNAVNGIATFDDLKVDRLGAAYRLTATAAVTGNPQATSDAFNVGAAAAANLTIVGGNNQSAPAGVTVESRPSVRVTDASGNPVLGATVTFTPNAGSGSVTGGSQTTDANGVATVGSWTVGTVVGTSTLVASVTGAPSVNFTANVGPGTPTALVFTTQPTNVASLAAIASFTVSIFDQYGNLATNAGATQVSLSIASGTGTAGAALSGTTAANTVGGVATFANVRIDKAGVGYRLAASGTGLTPAQSATFNVTAGAAANMAAVAGTDGLSAQVGTAVSAAPAVLVTDAGGNPVAGVAVTFAVTGGGGSIVPTTPVSTGANGIASATTWTMGSTLGQNTARASAGGLPNVNFTATATSGGVAGVSTTAGGGVEPPPTVNNNTAFGAGPKVQLVDGAGNPVSLSGVTVTAEVVTGSGDDFEEIEHGPSASSAIPGATLTVSPSEVSTNASGVADFSASVVRGVVGTYSLRFRVTLGEQVFIVHSRTFEVRPGAVVNLAAWTTLPAYALWGAVLVPKVVATDIDQNLVVGAPVIFAVTGGTGTLGSPATVVTGADGVATSPNFTLPNVDFAANQVTACSAGVPITNCSTVPPVSFTVASTHPTRLVVIQQHASGTTFANGAALSQFQVQLRDAANRDIRLSNVVITAEPGPDHTFTYNLEGTTSASTDLNGLATFSNLSIDAVAQSNLSVRFATTYTTAGAPISPVLTNPFNAVPGAAQNLVSNTATTTFATPINTAFSPAPSVAAMDRFNRNVVPSATNNVLWTVLGCAGTTATTPKPMVSGVGTATITAGSTASSCFIQASTVELNGIVPFTLVVLPGAGYVYFTGGSGAVWGLAGNWSNAQAPTATTDVFIAQRFANPGLNANGTARNVVVEGSSTARIDVGTFTLTVNGNLDAGGGGIIGTTGVVSQAAPSGTTVNVQGTVPNFTAASCVSPAAVALNGTTTVFGTLTANCRVNAGNRTLNVNGSLSIGSAGSFDMTTGSSVLITGNASFTGQQSNLTGGTLELRGNLSENGAGGVLTAFAASGAHTTVFSGTGSQTMNFVHAEPTHSRFENLVITNTTAGGVTLTSDAKVMGDVDVNTNARLVKSSVGNLYIYGTIRLHSNSTLDLIGTASLEPPNGRCQRHNGTPPATISGANGPAFAANCTLANLP